MHDFLGLIQRYACRVSKTYCSTAIGQTKCNRFADTPHPVEFRNILYLFYWNVDLVVIDLLGYITVNINSVALRTFAVIFERTVRHFIQTLAVLVMLAMITWIISSDKLFVPCMSCKYSYFLAGIVCRDYAISRFTSKAFSHVLTSLLWKLLEIGI